MSQSKTQHPQPHPLAQHQQPSAGRRSHRTLPKDQTQLLSLQHDHRHRERERERERQRQRDRPVAAVQKLMANSGGSPASTAATAAAVAASSPSRPANSQRSVVKKPAFHSREATFYHSHIPLCHCPPFVSSSHKVVLYFFFGSFNVFSPLSPLFHLPILFFLHGLSLSSLSELMDPFHLKVIKVWRK